MAFTPEQIQRIVRDGRRTAPRMVAPKFETEQVCPDCASNMVALTEALSVPLGLQRQIFLELAAAICPNCGLVKLFSARVLRGESLDQ
jgi:transcription elongation factor Elf1